MPLRPMLILWKPIVIHSASANCWYERQCLFKTVGTWEFAVQLAVLSRVALFRCDETVAWAITVHLYRTAGFRIAVFNKLDDGQS